MHTIAITPTSEHGVVIWQWTSQLSRMQVWDAETLAPGPVQDLKGRAWLMDISPEGRYVAYFAEVQRRQEAHLAISRPPYFHALFIRNAHHCMVREVFFGDGAVHYARYPQGWGWPVPDSETPNAPFKFVEIDFEDHLWSAVRAERAARCSDPSLQGSWPQGESSEPAAPWSAIDRCGRRITLGPDGVDADGTTFLPCERAPFESVAPPDWAKEW